MLAATEQHDDALAFDPSPVESAAGCPRREVHGEPVDEVLDEDFGLKVGVIQKCTSPNYQAVSNSAPAENRRSPTAPCPILVTFIQESTGINLLLTRETPPKACALLRGLPGVRRR